MREDLLDIRNRIRAGRFPNEAAVSQGIVRRVLDLLSWPVYDTDIVMPEYSLGGRRVDYALCHPPARPTVFIEVKQAGQSSGADRQLFEYAFHRGVPMAILTDGQEWHFFLPGERGDYGERRVYKLDVLERDIEESVLRLTRYLDYGRVCSGEVLEAARNDYRDVAKEREIHATLPEAWNKLIDDGDDLLVELIADKVESLCGYKPDPDAVASFLAQRLRLGGVSLPPVPTSRVPPAPQQRLSVSYSPQREELEPFGFVLFGQRYSASSGRDVLVKVLKALADRDAGFLERFAALPKRNRRYLARSREELYPRSPQLALGDSYSRELSPGAGWWVDVNLSRSAMERVIQMACQVAGLTYGTDLRVRLGPDD